MKTAVLQYWQQQRWLETDMGLLRLSRVLGIMTDTLIGIVVNGWMSGAYTGAVLTEQYHRFR